MNNNCPNCGTENKEGEKICKACGNELKTDFAEDKVCPKCYTKYPSSTLFCVKDGTALVYHQELIPKCVVCKTPYADGRNFCPKDGGEVKVILPDQHSQKSDHKKESFLEFGTVQVYPKASLGNRFLAALLDALIFFALAIPSALIILASILNFKESKDLFIFFLLVSLGILFFLIPIVYGFIKDGLGQGQSWGKKAFGVMVVDLEKNKPCSIGKSALRNLVSTLVSNVVPTLGGLIEPIMVLANEDGRKVADYASKTQVIDVASYKNQNRL